MSPIFNASSLTLTQNSGTLPDVSGAMRDYFQTMTFTQVTKSIVNFKVVETAASQPFLGVIQPFSAQELEIKPEGERAWKWFTLHAELGVILNPDDVVTYQSIQYRVKSKTDYSLYGYLEYHVIQDFTGAGPT